MPRLLDCLAAHMHGIAPPFLGLTQACGKSTIGNQYHAMPCILGARGHLAAYIQRLVPSEIMSGIRYSGRLDGLDGWTGRPIRLGGWTTGRVDDWKGGRLDGWAACPGRVDGPPRTVGRVDG